MQELVSLAYCVKRQRNYGSVTVGTFYRVLADPKAARHKMIRIVDDSGEDYLYAREHFVVAKLPAQAAARKKTL